MAQSISVIYHRRSVAQSISVIYHRSVAQSISVIYHRRSVAQSISVIYHRSVAQSISVIYHRSVAHSIYICDIPQEECGCTGLTVVFMMPVPWVLMELAI